MISNLTEKLNILRIFDRQYRRPQKGPFQSSFTQSRQFTQGISQFSHFACRQHDGIISRHSIHSTDEHRMIYSFSNTTFYSIFYAFFSFFGSHYNIMADVTTKQQTAALFLSTIVTRTRRHTELQKTDTLDGKPVVCQRTFLSVLRAIFLHS